MKIAITGGTGFVGGHLAESLARNGHEVVVLARGLDDRPWARHVRELPGITVVRAGIGDTDALAEAFDGCDAVAHCAGINRELGAQTYDAVHVRGTANVVAEAERAGVRRLALVSFLRARPGTGSGYHESKWQAEQIVRSSSLDWTVLKPGMIYGHGDHMLDHLSHALHTFPVFVGVGTRLVAPLAVADLVTVLEAALVAGRLSRATIPVLGPTVLSMDESVKTVAAAMGRERPFLRAPMAFHRLLAEVSERVMTVPLISISQVRILREGVVEPAEAPDTLPADLRPTTAFDEQSIIAGLPAAGRFGAADLRWCAGRVAA